MSKMINQSEAAPEQSLAGASVERSEYQQRQSFGQLLRGDLGFIPVLLTLILIAVFFALTTNGLFLTPRNLSNLTLQIVEYGIDALGVTLVLLLGEIDLSVAAVGTFSAVVMGVLSARVGLPAWEAITLGLLAGAIAGLINGLLIAIVRIPAFIVTLAASIFYSGLLLNLLQGQATLILNDQSIINLATTYLTDLFGVGLPTLVLLIYIIGVLANNAARKRKGLRSKTTGQLVLRLVITAVVVEGMVALFENNLGVPRSVAIWIGLIFIFWLILTKTSFGRHIYAVGGNLEAARRAGMNVVAIRVAAFTLCSTLAAVGGILEASRETAVASQIDSSLLLNAIAAAVIGGVSLFGGVGSVWPIILGALIIGSLENGLDLKSQGADVKQMIEGVVLVLAVASDALIRRAQKRSASGR
jgi:D-xylose transport system permease protein